MLLKKISFQKNKTQVSYVYANEADLLNVALFGMTAKQWREANPYACPLYTSDAAGQKRGL